MNPKLWRELPVELQQRVLASLPPPDLFRFRVVCKNWNALVTAPTFRELCGQIPHPNSYALIAPTYHLGCDIEGWSVIDIRADRWYTIPDQFLLSRFMDGDDFKDGFVRTTVAADGGLVCVMCKPTDVSDVVLVVCNPLAKTVKELPHLPIKRREPGYRWAVVMVANDMTNSYKVFLIANYLENEAANDRFHVYDSRIQRWRSLSKVPDHSSVSSSILFRGLLYTLFGDAVAPDSRLTLLAYDIDKDLWMETGVQIPESLQISQLVVTNRSLYLFGGLDEENEDVDLNSDYAPEYLRTLHIWEVQISSKKCVEIEQIPQTILQGIFENRFETLFQGWSEDGEKLSLGHDAIIKAVGFGTSIIITSWIGIPAIYELSNCSWRLLPVRHLLEYWIGMTLGLCANLINLNLGAQV